YVDYKADIESFRKRDEARAELVEFIQGVMNDRIANPTENKEERDLMDVLVQVGFDANTITGMFISMMFAGHHTTSGTAAWTLIELLRNPEYMSRV
ncbi:cytochrome P450, partial [Streptomyces sp. SID10244]|nr:cytochrome P450 [Streptomyces sp. SID10244]